MNKRDIRESVREGYGAVARGGGGTSEAQEREDSRGCCEPTCCGGGSGTPEEHALNLGYERFDLEHIPEDANLALGCGNPAAMAEIKAGEVVLDLGSGAGMDAFLAAARVGEDGQVIGVDMTPEMLARARNLAHQRGLSHFVEFRRGYIEDLPVTTQSVDVVLSNCVINLSTDKSAVFAEAFRVLKPGGRLAISDICLTEPLPEEVRQLEGAYIACVSGALVAGEYEAIMARAGFVDITWTRTLAAPLFEGFCADPVLQEAIASVPVDQVEQIRDSVWSYKFFARKP